jgi:hypothetical protein
MKLTEEEILERVNQTEEELSAHRAMTKTWERMWQLDAGFSKTWKQAVEQEGREQVTLPDPYNIVNLAMRLIATQPRIMVPPKSPASEDIDAGEKIERWLSGMWDMVKWQQNRNLIADATWQALVLGSCVFEVKWIKDVLPKKLQGERFPILVRTLDPREVGIKRGPLYVEWAYHRYTTDLVTAKQRYPKLKKWKETTFNRKSKGDDEVCIIDWWHTDSEGDVWNAIMVDDEFHKKPMRMADYPYIPIIEGFGDSAPTLDEAYRRVSILYALDGLWQFKCRLASNMATGALWGTWPYYLVSTPTGEMMDDIKVRPGATQAAPMGTQIQTVMPAVDIGKIQTMMQQVDTSIQQATFPGVMYGEAGGMQAGYGINLLSAAAQGRVKGILESLEMTVQAVNSLALAMVDLAGGSKGVDIYSLDKVGNRTYTENISKKEIAGYYRNIVTLKPNVPQDSMAKESLAIQLYGNKLISARTVRENYLSDIIPSDEEARIWTEQALQLPEMQPRVMLLYFIEKYPDTWQELIKGKPLEQEAIQMGLLPPPEPPPPPPGMGDPNMMPPGMGGPPGMPPMGDPSMMPPGMGDPSMMGMPPGMGGPPMGQPPPGGGGVPGPPIQVQPDATIVPPLGGGVPPVMNAQIEAEQLGLPPDVDPRIFQQLMGRPLTPEEELALLQQQGGGGLPPG